MFSSQGLFKLVSEFELWEKFFSYGGSVINKDTLSYDKVFLTTTTSNRTQVCSKGLSSQYFPTMFNISILNCIMKH